MTAEDYVKAISALKLRKAKALLFFLVSAPGSRHRNEMIMDLLWQSSEVEKAAASFRQAVRQVRVGTADLRGVDLETGSGLITVNLPVNLALGRALVEQLQADGLTPEVEDFVRRFMALLDSLKGISGSFDSWLAISHAKTKADISGELDSVFAGRAGGEDAVNAARFALELEPSNEAAARFLMQFHWSNKAPTRAIEIYNALYRYLDETFDQEPEPDTVSLLAAIKLEPTAPPPAASISFQESPRIRVTIEPRSDAGLSRELSSLSAVLVADFRMRMSRFREWCLVEPGAADPALITIRLELLAHGETQQLQVDVLSAPEGELLWSEAIANPTENWEQKQRNVMINIASALSVAVTARAGADTGAQVYDRWLRSQTLLDAWSPETEGEAVLLLTNITADEPRFGPAHAELAGALNVRHVLLPGTFQTEDVKQKALHHALEAIAIDPLDTRAHRVLAWCYCHKREFELAEFHFDQSLSLNRQSPLTLTSCAMGYAFSGNLEQAARLVHEAKTPGAPVEPFHLVYLAAADYLCGDYAATVAQCRDATGLMPTVGGWHAAALCKLGKSDEARHRFAAYIDEIRPIWRGTSPANNDTVLDWFVSIFPLRDTDQLGDIRQTLEGIA